MFAPLVAGGLPYLSNPEKPPRKLLPAASPLTIEPYISDKEGL
jgi:hypothetical protein